MVHEAVCWKADRTHPMEEAGALPPQDSADCARRNGFSNLDKQKARSCQKVSAPQFGSEKVVSPNPCGNREDDGNPI